MFARALLNELIKDQDSYKMLGFIIFYSSQRWLCITIQLVDLITVFSEIPTYYGKETIKKPCSVVNAVSATVGADKVWESDTGGGGAKVM